jgi:hypothetical protein
MPQFKSHQGTYVQLTNAGYLNYFDKKIASQLTDYYVACNQLKELQDIEQHVLLDRLIPFLQLHFHTENLVSWRKEKRLVESSELKDWDDKAIWYLHNLVNELRFQNMELQVHNEKLEAIALQLNRDLSASTF